MKKRILLGVLAVLVIGLAVIWGSLESIVKKVVNKYGSEVTGTEVRLEGFNLSPFSGTASISSLTVANPENYKSPYLLSLGGISVKVDMKSLTSDTIIIEDITIDKPVITYEMLSLTQNNIKQLQSNISKNTASAEKSENKAAAKTEKTAEDKAAAKKVIIKKVTVRAGELKAFAGGSGDQALADVKLPEIVLTDIGSQKKSENIASSIAKVLNKILSTASQTVIKSGLGDLKNVARKNLDNVVGGVKDKVKNFGIFKK